MQKITFTYVEEYLEVIAGIREVGNKPNGKYVSTSNDPPLIRLARYDVNIVNSISRQIGSNIALTDRQGELVHKLLLKYQRQLLSVGVALGSHIINPVYRMPIRQIDRSRALFVQDNLIVLKFSYDRTLVDLLVAYSKVSQGSCNFNKDTKNWSLVITEANISWATKFAELYDFTQTPAITQLMQLVTDCELIPYEIQLDNCNGTVSISNAASSLIDYINSNLGGISAENMLRLADYSSILGYTLSPAAIASLSLCCEPGLVDLVTNKNSHAPRLDMASSGANLLIKVAAYAELTNRWPIYVYEPDGSKCLLNTIKSMFTDDEILVTPDRKSTAAMSSSLVDISSKKCVYFTKLKRMWNHPIPCLVSTHAMLYGSEKQHMLHQAEKVIYYTASTYDADTMEINENLHYTN